MHCYTLQGARELPPDGSDNRLNIPQPGVAAGQEGQAVCAATEACRVGSVRTP